MSEVTTYRMKPVAPMTVGALLDIIHDLKLPASAKVVMFSDAEGNDIKPLLEVGKMPAKVSVSSGYGQVDEVGRQQALLLIPYD